MAPARLPRYRADAWAGGFAVASPVYTRSISAVDGTVVAATERIYRLRPGATAFQTREPPEGAGDVVAVAVEPRRRGREQRIAVATMRELHPLRRRGRRIRAISRRPWRGRSAPVGPDDLDPARVGSGSSR